MESIMTVVLPMPARLRMSTGAFAGSGCAANLGRLHGTGVPVFGYTPAIVDVVKNGEFPGVQAWSPPV